MIQPGVGVCSTFCCYHHYLATHYKVLITTKSGNLEAISSKRQLLTLFDQAIYFCDMKRHAAFKMSCKAILTICDYNLQYILYKFRAKRDSFQVVTEC